MLNPMAGRDIRRLVAFASLQSTPEKLQVVRRILSGIAVFADQVDVLMPEDYEGLTHVLRDEARRLFGLSVELVGAPGGPSSADTTVRSARELVDAGAELLIAIGGDGTQRNVAQAEPKVPVLPVAGGTNNVACWVGDQTVAGFAAGSYVMDPGRYQEQLFVAKVLHLTRGSGSSSMEDLALIDVALVRQTFTGALAVWNPEDVVQLWLAVADPVRPGLSNLGGQVCPVAPEEDALTWLQLGTGDQVAYGALAPGMMAKFLVDRHQKIPLNQEILIQTPENGGSLALDGERTLVLSPCETVTLVARRDGPRYLFPQRILNRGTLTRTLS